MGRVKQNNQFTKDLFTLDQNPSPKTFAGLEHLNLPASWTNFVLRVCILEFALSFMDRMDRLFLMLSLVLRGVHKSTLSCPSWSIISDFWKLLIILFLCFHRDLSHNRLSFIKASSTSHLHSLREVWVQLLSACGWNQMYHLSQYLIVKNVWVTGNYLKLLTWEGSLNNVIKFSPLWITDCIICFSLSLFWHL